MYVVSVKKPELDDLQIMMESHFYDKLTKTCLLFNLMLGHDIYLTVPFPLPPIIVMEPTLLKKSRKKKESNSHLPPSLSPILQMMGTISNGNKKLSIFLLVGKPHFAFFAQQRKVC